MADEREHGGRHFAIERKRGFTRRQFLGFGAGALATAILAACGPEGSPTAAPVGQTTPAAGTTPAAQTAAKKGGAFHGAWPYDVPPKGHFNHAKGVTDGILTTSIYRDLERTPLGMYFWKDKKWMQLLATEQKFDGDNFRVTLRQNVKWSDGKPFTSKDVLTTFWILRIMRQPVWNFIDKVDVEGENAVVFHMARPATVVERYIMRENMLSDATYGEWAKKAQDLFAAGKTVDSDEFKQLNQEFQRFRPTESITTGPYKLDPASMTNARVDLLKVPTSFLADKVNFDKVVLFNGETPDVTPVVLAKDVDYATHGFPPATEQAFAQAGIRIGRPPVFNGRGLGINFDKLGNVFGDKRVRQAIAHALDREQNAKVTYADSGKGVKAPTNIAEAWLPDWLKKEDIDKLNTYPYDVNKATQMLTELGWKKGGDGVWTAADGTRCDFEMLVEAEFADASASAQNIAEQLTKFGIKTAIRTVNFTQVPIDIDKGNFQLCSLQWGTSADPFPQFAFDSNLIRFTVRSANQGGKGIAFPLKQQTDSVGEVDFQQLTVEMGQGLDVEKQKEAVTKAVKAFNELLPMIPTYERFGNNPILEGVRVTGWPKDDDVLFQNAAYADSYVIISMLEGRLQPV